MISEEEHKQMPEPVRERLEALKEAPGSVIVVGSMNADYTVTTKRLPKPGETVNGGAMKVLPGGKGANQASAAARLGVNVQLLGAVGEDSNADFLLSKLDEAGVDTADILHVEGPSGTTVITVSAEGENTIVYSPGSNAKASAGYVQSHRTTIAECAVLGLCLESPICLTNWWKPRIFCWSTSMKRLNCWVCRTAMWNHSTGMRSPNDSPITDSTGR